MLMARRGGDGRGFIENLGGALRIAWALATPFLRGRRLRWGATAEDLARRFPGDDLVPTPRWQYLHAVSVEAEASAVWPWVAQLGQGRGGFYSYQRLENLAGCRIQNTERILDEHQHVAPGDGIKLHPTMPGLPVVLFDPPHVLGLHACDDLSSGQRFDPAGPRPARFLSLSWVFVVEEDGPGRSRLFSRYRADYGGGRAIDLSYGPWLVEPVSFPMDTKMLCGIRLRAERMAGTSGA
jgi:hypothetical protein